MFYKNYIFVNYLYFVKLYHENYILLIIYISVKLITIKNKGYNFILIVNSIYN